MAAKETLQDYAEEHGWNTETMLHLACTYIDQQESDEFTFEEFLEEKADDEDLECAGDPNDEPTDEEDD